MQLRTLLAVGWLALPLLAKAQDKPDSPQSLPSPAQAAPKPPPIAVPP
ncbi:MAG TPA: hypothetical protein VFB21_05070 [Chthonomonadaceae bacterium]|nr:hypothetical protein [Chthonomonadaceae bacterium]